MKPDVRVDIRCDEEPAQSLPSLPVTARFSSLNGVLEQARHQCNCRGAGGRSHPTLRFKTITSKIYTTCKVHGVRRNLKEYRVKY